MMVASGKAITRCEHRKRKNLNVDEWPGDEGCAERNSHQRQNGSSRNSVSSGHRMRCCADTVYWHWHQFQTFLLSSLCHRGRKNKLHFPASCVDTVLGSFRVREQDPLWKVEAFQEYKGLSGPQQKWELAANALHVVMSGTSLKRGGDDTSGFCGWCSSRCGFLISVWLVGVWPQS